MNHEEYEPISYGLDVVCRPEKRDPSFYEEARNTIKELKIRLQKDNNESR